MRHTIKLLMLTLAMFSSVQTFAASATPATTSTATDNGHAAPNDKLVAERLQEATEVAVESTWPVVQQGLIPQVQKQVDTLSAAQALIVVQNLQKLLNRLENAERVEAGFAMGALVVITILSFTLARRMYRSMNGNELITFAGIFAAVTAIVALQQTAARSEAKKAFVANVQRQRDGLTKIKANLEEQVKADKNAQRVQDVSTGLGN